MALQIPNNAAMVRRDGLVTPVWLAFFLRLVEAASSGGGSAAPANATYILGSANGSLPNGRVLTDTPSIDVDLGTAGQARFHVIVDPAGALEDGPLAVRVDGVTVQVNGDNALEVVDAPGSQWSVLTNGDPVNPELIFAGGDVVMLEY